MPKLIAHALAGATIVTAIHPSAGIKNWLPIAVGAFLAVSPDLDIGLDWIFNVQSIHRGFSHSVFFSLLIGIIIWLLMNKRNGNETIAFSLAYLSHPLLDLLTSTSGGIQIFYPLSNRYYNLGLTDLFEYPVTPIFQWVLIELLCFLPLFLIVLFLKRLNFWQK